MGYDFNPRSPSGLRHHTAAASKIKLLFQSTQPEWAATYYLSLFERLKVFQSTQPEWAATDEQRRLERFTHISIHAARVGCDNYDPKGTAQNKVFQSTQPEWAATVM